MSIILSSNLFDGYVMRVTVKTCLDDPCDGAEDKQKRKKYDR